MTVKMGIEMAAWESRNAAKIHEARKAHEDFNNKIRGAFRILINHHRDDIDCCFISWIVSVTLAPGVKLKEECYSQLSEYFDFWPEKSFSHMGVLEFSWECGGTFGYFDVKLSRGTCKVREITTVETVTREEKSTKFELIGDCSGLEV